MIILGDISGIQSYLFDVAEAGGGQAQRLRARSFVIQLVAEAAAITVLRALGWSLGSFVLSGAGKFVLRGPSEAVAERLAAARQAIDGWLLRETRGELRLALGLGDSASEVEAYRQAQRELQRAKARPWAPPDGGGWKSSSLVLDPLGTPCDLCHHAPAVESETDSDTGEDRRICRWCARMRRLGRKLPAAHWLVIREPAQADDLDLFGFGVTVPEGGRVAVGPETVAVANLRQPERPPDGCPPERFLPRRLMAHVPTDRDGGVTWFEALAQQARGDRLLGVLKADADSLGAEIDRRLGGSDLQPLVEFSDTLDAFFAGCLRAEMVSDCDSRWRSIYTVFAGGDDLVMVGPWDVMLDFAGRIEELFRGQFGRDKLTLSAGLALVKWKQPIKGTVAEAERLLERAKTEPKGDSKDQLACFGQMWKWKYHSEIQRTAQQLVRWVQEGQMQRGWLHTLLGLTEARHPAVLLDHTGRETQPDHLATARLAHHVARNYRWSTEARRWADRLVEQFDDLTHATIRYLPAILRYALTATRTPSEEE